MLSLGKLQETREQKKTYTFNELLRDKELVETFKQDAKMGLGILSVILLPDKYPSAALIFEFPQYKIKRTLRGEELIAWLKAEGFDKKTGKSKVQYRLRISDDGEIIVYELQIAKGGYIKTDYGFKFTDTNKDEEDSW